MNGRERIEAAFSSEGAPEIPAVICYEGIYVRDHWPQLTVAPWWIRHVTNVEVQEAWRRRVAAAIGQDWFQLPTGSSHVERFYLSVEEWNGEAILVDSRMGRTRPLTPPAIGGWPGHRIASVHPEDRPQTERELDLLIGPGETVAEVLADGRADLSRQILSDWGASLYPLRHVVAPLWSCYHIWGFEGLMLQIVDRPDLVRYAVDRYTERALRDIRLAARLGARGVWIEDCMTDMISPRHFMTYNLPSLRRLTAEIRAHDMHSIYYFCGNPTKKWALLLNTGADALSLEESKKGFVIDIDEVVERIDGRMILLGNLDAINLLEKASEDELRAEIARQIAAGRRNSSRFIMSLGSPVTPNTPASRVRLYCDLVHELGR